MKKELLFAIFAINSGCSNASNDLLNSTRTLILFGVCLGSVWGLFGVCLGSVWGLFGVCLGSVWGQVLHRNIFLVKEPLEA
jgi:ABC-type microcin C transport system permease subunit YejE